MAARDAVGPPAPQRAPWAAGAQISCNTQMRASYRVPGNRAASIS
jgi:hypothetical protein